MNKQVIINELELHYSRFFKELDIKVKYALDSYPFNASGNYDVLTRTITMNLTDAAVSKYDKTHYIVAMAHELGHAYDYKHRGVVGTYVSMAKAIWKRDTLEYTLQAEHNAYTYGLAYIPYRYKRVYHMKNKAYLQKIASKGA